MFRGGEIGPFRHQFPRTGNRLLEPGVPTIMRTTKPRNTICALAATSGALLLLAACGTQTLTTGGGTPKPARPAGADDVVLQVMVAGGFVPVDISLSTVPTVTVLGDGTVITPAPVPAIYPGPAMAPHQAVKVDAAAVDGLIGKAADLGLLADDLDYGQPPIADAPSTVVTISAAGRTYRHTAYGLGLADGLGTERTEGFSPGQATNRRNLLQLLEATQELPPGESEWKPTAIAVYAVGEYQPDPQLTQPETRWPLPGPPTQQGRFRCTLVEGDDLATLQQSLVRANARTPWVVDGKVVSLTFRPVLPGQPGCEPAEPAGA